MSDLDPYLLSYVCMYVCIFKLDLALNNPRRLVRHQTQPTNKQLTMGFQQLVIIYVRKPTTTFFGLSRDSNQELLVNKVGNNGCPLPVFQGPET